MPFDLDALVAAKVTSKLTGTAGSILDVKGCVVHSIGPDETVYAAVSKLKEFGLGALMVMNGPVLIGVISERDYTRKIILEGRASKTTRVAEIMTSPVVCIEAQMPLADCLRVMSERRVRHLPVLEDGRVIGVLSIRDLVNAIILQQEQTIEQLSTLLTDPYPA